MAFSASTPFPYQITPLTNIVPFTYRDGTTFLETLEKLRVWLNNSLVPEFNAGIDNAIKEFQRGIDNAEKRVIETEEMHKKLIADAIDYVNTNVKDARDYVDEAIRNINNKTGQVQIQRIRLTANYELSIDRFWPDNHPVEVVFTQDAKGGHVVTFSTDIIGPFKQKLEPGSVTRLTLIPTYVNGKWEISQPTIDLQMAAGHHVRLTGIGDESAKIQAVLDSVPEGATVVLPPITINATGLKMRPSTKLIGHGRGATILRASGDGPGYLLQTSGQATVSDIKFQTGEYDVTLIDVFESARVGIDRVYLEGNANLKKGVGIKYSGSATNKSAHGNQVSNTIIMNLDIGIWGRSWCYDNEFNQVWIGPCNIGMHMASGSHMINGIHIWGCTNNGLSLYTIDGGYSRISNAYLETNGGYGAYVQNAEGNTFTNTRFWKNGLGGVLVRDGHNTRFVGCWADDNIGTGFIFQDHLNGELSACHAYDIQPTKTQTYGVRTTGTTDFLMLTGCHMAREDHKVGSYSLVGDNNNVYGNTFDRLSARFQVGYTEKKTGAGVELRSAAGTAKTISFVSGTTGRWGIGVNDFPENGNDEGADFVIVSRSDSGTALHTPIHIERRSGKVSLHAPLRFARLETANRPTPQDAGAGSLYYDTDKVRFIYSDGGFWRDLVTHEES